ncbi:MAG: sugar transferase [Verrucomicrobia bacterium]|nr:sugar transferase [Verrucomicrobiota bacterium]
MYQRAGKRVLDLTVVILTVPLWLPLLIIVAVWVRMRLGTPVLFTQTRPGLHGKPFRLYKFRTLSQRTDADGNLLPDAQRITPVGALLRATSLDELPELWNILRGDMSLVGPRPLLLQYLPRYNTTQAQRHSVLPGLTGWAQVQGRNAISWEQKLALDYWYVQNQSLGLDLKILIITLRKVLLREGVTATGEATAAEFMGSPNGTPEPEALVAPDGRLRQPE